MSDALALMQALVGQGPDRAEVAAMLAQALDANVDPMRWCAVHLALSEVEIMQRAADWAELAYLDVVPRNSRLDAASIQVARLGSVQVITLGVLDIRVAFAAPDFFGVLRLRRARMGPDGLSRKLCLVPYSALRSFLASVAAPNLIAHARQELSRRWPYAVAQLELTGLVRWAFAFGVLALLALLLIAPILGQAWLFPLWAVLVLAPAALRVFALAMPERPPSAQAAVEEAALPTYSILLPLRDEANMVDQLANALSRLDYPAEKLDILFVVEAASPETVAAVERRLGDPRFGLLVVPDALPRTKPKALDFALPLCRGEFVDVYDAEDRPHPRQLKDIVAQFRREPMVECIQARLVIANGRRGWLPAVFAGEYAGLFSVILPALARWGLFMPLGGTSNHFRLSTLRQLGGWDAFNVTEDADLGARLARRGLRSAVNTSFTLEDAPVALKSWMGQRTRWMKGWMQTYLVHNRRPRHLLADLGWRQTLMFQVILLGMILAPLLHGGFLLGLALLYGTGLLDWPRMDAWAILCITTLLIGQTAAIATNIVGLHRIGQKSLWVTQLSVPIYWLLIAWATLRALFELAIWPYYWFKTPHSIVERPALPDVLAARSGARKVA